MEKIWLNSYQPGVAQEIDSQALRSVVQVFEESVTRFRHRPAMTNMGKVISYEELDQLSLAFASYLQNVLALKSGSRVALMMPNILQYPVCVFGILRTGCTVVNVNPLYTARELEYQLKDAQVDAIVILENFCHVLEKVASDYPVKHVIVASIGDLLGTWRGPLVNFVVRTLKRAVPPWRLPAYLRFNDAIAAGKRHAFRPLTIQANDIAFLQYTGGTTGISKGAMLLHRNIVANMLQAREWVKSVVKEGEEVIVTALPLYHIFSLTANLMVFSQLGALNVLITNPRDIRGFIKELKKHRITAITGVNTLFNALVHHPDFQSIDFSSWRLALGGGAAVQKAVADQWKSVTGIPLIEAYGLTETSPAACINPMNLKDYNGSIGLPLPSTDIQIRDEAGNEVPIGKPGELFIRGPQVMSGYWNRADETAKAIGPDGFLATGDIALIESTGFIKLIDRKKDMILVSGFNVYPNEIEAVIAACPGVLEVACIGIPDEKTGEAVKIFIVRSEGSLSKTDVLSYCRQNLTAYKMPKYIEFRDELPKTNIGKILRRELREQQTTETG